MKKAAIMAASWNVYTSALRFPIAIAAAMIAISGIRVASAEAIVITGHVSVVVGPVGPLVGIRRVSLPITLAVAYALFQTALVSLRVHVLLPVVVTVITVLPVTVLIILVIAVLILIPLGPVLVIGSVLPILWRDPVVLVHGIVVTPLVRPVLVLRLCTGGHRHDGCRCER